MNSLLDLSLVRRDKDKVYPIIYYTLKGLLKDWENALAERPREYSGVLRLSRTRCDADARLSRI